MSDGSTKKYIRPISKVSEITEVPPVEGILAKTISTIANEITKLHNRSHVAALSDREAKVLQGYVKSLVDLSREQRERDKANDMSDMSYEELLEFAKQIISKQEQNDKI